ncbi:VWA domain-containing protein [Kribbella sandramycini]|uniref:Mg-chelatase subunit ChlD n=1 Tax=Kribbella sandramycini TaxID=60450 RepID=A0A7Y4L5D6_9ACTN|nr:VWA domain-containing protein [Kribbella sandramycini]MBB6566901.1 Mg-chelatase subunit ChlD [Kribbella sandramycini]NOL44623.1 VWA domain-containing protein [Kribbella sandramycini]
MTAGEVERWRLVLGRYAGSQLGEAAAGSEQARMEAALDYLYGREYGGRGVREPSGAGDSEDGLGGGRGSGAGGAGSEPSAPALVTWLSEVRELFPRETVEIVERHALDRYGLTELVTDPELLERLEPDIGLLKTLLALKGHLGEETLEVARRIIRQVIDELRRRLELEVRAAMAGRLSQHRHSPLAIAANFDPHGTIRRNLKHYDPEGQRLVLADVLFFQRNARRLPWDIIVCVDQSGSMADSIIHSAVMAGILSGLPAFRVRLVLFDTSVVDLSAYVDDPVDILMRVQLGGGTDIARAVRYCAQLVENPQRTVMVLVTDFCEGGPPSELIRVVRELAAARVRLLGLAALDGDAAPAYDRAMAGRLADEGMEIAALTPGQLASWLVEVTG